MASKSQADDFEPRSRYERRGVGEVVELRFRRRGKSVRLLEAVDAGRLELPVHLSGDDLPPGIFIWELRNDAGELLHRGAGVDPLGLSAEVYPAPRGQGNPRDPERDKFTRVGREGQTAYFELFVPKFDGDVSVLLYSREYVGTFGGSWENPVAKSPIPEVRARGNRRGKTMRN
jgi:hypothetical protein